MLIDAQTACDLLRFRLRRIESGFRRPDQTHLDDYNYYAFRFGQPRDLVALSLTGIIPTPRRPLLDLGCGCGHITRHLIRHAKGQPVIGLDKNFFLLYLAKQWIAPEASYVCAEADHPLPFRDETFDAAVCSDAFHYFLDKQTSIQELKRVTDRDAVIVLATVRNAEVAYRFPGSPLSPEEYARLLGGPHRMIPDASILARYLGKTGPALAHPVPVTNRDPLSVVLTNRADIFQDYGSFPRWPHAEEGELAVNPLYTVVSHGETILLTLTFPSAWYEEDNSECKHYLWRSITAPATVLHDLSRGERTPEVERLIDQFAVLGLPARFGQPRAA